MLDWNWTGVTRAELSSAVRPEGPAAVLCSLALLVASVVFRLIASSSDGPCRATSNVLALGGAGESFFIVFLSYQSFPPRREWGFPMRKSLELTNEVPNFLLILFLKVFPFLSLLLSLFSLYLPTLGTKSPSPVRIAFSAGKSGEGGATCSEVGGGEGFACAHGAIDGTR